MLFIVCSVVSCRYFDDAIITPVPSNCNEKAVVDGAYLSNIKTTNYGITQVVLNGDCLEVTVSSSGCNPDNWDMNLFAAVSPLIVAPTVYIAKIELINNEACLAVFQKTVSFDLKPLQIATIKEIQIWLDGWNTPIFYKY